MEEHLPLLHRYQHNSDKSRWEPNTFIEKGLWGWIFVLKGGVGVLRSWQNKSPLLEPPKLGFDNELLYEIGIGIGVVALIVSTILAGVETLTGRGTIGLAFPAATISSFLGF